MSHLPSVQRKALSRGTVTGCERVREKEESGQKALERSPQKAGVKL